MLTSLTIKNWRTHANTTLEFGKGTNVIVGVMGSGKSSIVNAISHSLFGTFPAIKARQVSLEEIIMNKPNEAARAETTLEFEVEGAKYRVERIIKRDGTNEAKLYENGKLAAGPKQKDVNERIEKLLGLNYELFSRAVYAEQNEMDFFLKLSPSERKKKFDELLELDRYEDARKNAVALQNELTKENKQRKEFAEAQKHAIQSHEEEKIRKQIEEEEKAIVLLEKEIEDATKELLTIQKNYSELSNKEASNKALEDSMLKIGSKIESLKEDILKGEKVSLKENTAEIERLEKEVDMIKEKLPAKEKEHKEADLEAKKASEEIRVMEYERKKLADEEKGISALKGKCPTCRQELNEEHKKTLTKEISVKLQMLEGQIKDAENRKKSFGTKAAESEKEKEILRKEAEEKARALYKAEAAQKQSMELEEKKKHLKSLEIEMPKIKKDIIELGFEKKKLEGVRDEMYKKKSAMSVCETKIKAKKDLKKSYESNLEKIALIRKSIEAQESTMLKAEEAATKMGIFSNCLLATQVELRESLIETTNSAMNGIWAAVYPYKDFIDARLSIVADGYDLEVLTRNNAWVRVEGILSGGERSAAALCIRIAFALVLTKKLSMLILDEPTHNLDSNAVVKLSGMLREDLPKLVEQIFVITHDKQLENAASSNLYLLLRDKDADGATRVESIATN